MRELVHFTLLMLVVELCVYAETLTINAWPIIKAGTMKWKVTLLKGKRKKFWKDDYSIGLYFIALYRVIREA